MFDMTNTRYVGGSSIQLMYSG